MRKVITILLWRDVFSSFQERGTGIIPIAHEELNLRHSDLLSDEPHTVRCEVRLLLGTQTVLSHAPGQDGKTPFFKILPVYRVLCIYRPLFVKHVSQT